MPYGPGNRFKGPDFMAQAMDQERQQKEKEKQDQDLMKGFMALHKASPELQNIIPIQDFGDMSANAVRGIMEGLGAVVQQQQVQMQQQQLQQQAAGQQADIEAQQAMMGFREKELGFRERQAGRQLGLDVAQFQRQPSPIDIDGDGRPDFMMDPNQNLHRIPAPPMAMPDYGAELPGGAQWLGKIGTQGQPIFERPRPASIYDMMGSAPAVPGAPAPAAPAAPGGNQLLTRADFIADFVREEGRQPTAAEIQRFKGLAWR